MARIREVFSLNLRAALSRRGSIAKLEQTSGVSRVQISRYLNGTLPSEANLERICASLGLEEHALFSEDWSGGSKSMARFFELAGNSIGAGESFEMPRQGNALHLYFQVPDDVSHVCRSVVLLHKDQGETFFRRYTSFDAAGQEKAPGSINCHSGYISSVGWFFFMTGYNEAPPFEPSLVCASRTHFGIKVGFGSSIVLTLDGPKALKVAIEPLERFIDDATARRDAGMMKADRDLEGTAIRNHLCVNATPDAAMAV